MGNSDSAPEGLDPSQPVGYRIVTLTEGSPAWAAGLELQLDFIKYVP